MRQPKTSHAKCKNNLPTHDTATTEIEGHLPSPPRRTYRGSTPTAARVNHNGQRPERACAETAPAQHESDGSTLPKVRTTLANCEERRPEPHESDAVEGGLRPRHVCPRHRCPRHGCPRHVCPRPVCLRPVCPRHVMHLLTGQLILVLSAGIHFGPRTFHPDEPDLRITSPKWVIETRS